MLFEVSGVKRKRAAAITSGAPGPRRSPDLTAGLTERGRFDLNPSDRIALRASACSLYLWRNDRREPPCGARGDLRMRAARRTTSEHGRLLPELAAARGLAAVCGRAALGAASLFKTGAAGCRAYLVVEKPGRAVMGRLLLPKPPEALAVARADWGATP